MECTATSGLPVLQAQGTAPLNRPALPGIASRHCATAHLHEQYVVERLLESVCKLKYRGKSSTSRCSTIPPTNRCRRAHLSSAMPHWEIPYLPSPTGREGYKAGALAEGLKTAKGEFVTIFDADFMPLKISSPHHPPLHGSEDRHGANPLDPINRAIILTQVEAILLGRHFVLGTRTRS